MFDLLMHDGVRTEMPESSECTLDCCTASCKAFYGQDRDSQTWKAELGGIARGASMDTSSTERRHSVNQRRAKQRTWTHSQDVESLSAWSIAPTVRIDHGGEEENETRQTVRCRIVTSVRNNPNTVVSHRLCLIILFVVERSFLWVWHDIRHLNDIVHVASMTIHEKCQ